MEGGAAEWYDPSVSTVWMDGMLWKVRTEAEDGCRVKGAPMIGLSMTVNPGACSNVEPVLSLGTPPAALGFPDVPKPCFFAFLLA
jgi:hypothetical protein